MISLIYPSTGTATLSVVLRNPELGDSRQLNLKTMLKQNMAGAIYTHKKTGTNSKYLLTFRTLTLAQKDALISFYGLHVGHSIKYVDYANVSRVCKFANDSLVITTIQDGCSYDVTIELIGV